MEIKRIDREQIKQSLIEKGYVGKLISYEELQELYTEYGRGMSESDFAQGILEISYPNYSAVKHLGQKAKVLKDKKVELLPTEIEEIVQELNKRKYKGKSITYEELQKLYKEFGKGIGESNFAQTVLGVSYGNYMECKNKRTRVRVLKPGQSKLPQGKVEEILTILKEQGYVGKFVTYEELHELYKKYGKGIKESEFAQILGVSYSAYAQCKSRGSRTQVLKGEKIKLSQEQVKEIIQTLKNREYIGKSVTYQELHELYKEYGKGIEELEFARILGISFANYKSCKNKKTRAIIRDGIAKDKVKEIMLLYLGKPDCYSRDFINSICKEYDITFEDFITYVGLKGFFSSTNTAFLEQKEKIWIGKIRISEEFANANVDLIQSTARDVANIICKKYGKNSDRIDYEQEVIIYIIENLGAVEKNFGDNLKLFRHIILRSSQKYCEYMILNQLSLIKKVYFSRLTSKVEHGEEIEMQIADERANVEEQVGRSNTKYDFLEESNRCIKLLSEYIEEGCNRSEALEMTAQKMGIDSKTMLEYMKQYLLTNGKVRTTKRGTIEWCYK